MAALEKKLVQTLLVLGGETGRKTLFLHLRKRLKRLLAALSRKGSEAVKKFGFEILLVFGLILLLVYMYGTNAVNVYGYCASDVVLHNYWINEIGRAHV